MADLLKTNIEDELVIFEKDDNGKDEFIKLSKDSGKIDITNPLEISNGTKTSKINLDNTSDINTLKQNGANTKDIENISGDMTDILYNIKKELREYVEGLLVNSIGGDGKYIKSISQTDGKISPSVQSFDTSISSTSTNNNAPTSKAVNTLVDSEKTRATNKENELNTKISTEITNRSNGDSTLNTKIDSEILNRQNGDTSLDGKITTEKNRAEAKELELDKLIKGIEYITSDLTLDSEKIYYAFSSVRLDASVQAGYRESYSSPQFYGNTETGSITIPAKNYFKIKKTSSATSSGGWKCSARVSYAYSSSYNEIIDKITKDIVNATYNTAYSGGVSSTSASCSLTSHNVLVSKL